MDAPGVVVGEGVLDAEALIDTDGVCEGVGEAEAEIETVGVGDREEPCDGVTELDTDTLGVTEGVGVLVPVWDDVGVRVGVCEGAALVVVVGVGVGVGVRVGVADAAALVVVVCVGVGVRVGVGVAEAEIEGSAEAKAGTSALTGAHMSAGFGQRMWPVKPVAVLRAFASACAHTTDTDELAPVATLIVRLHEPSFACAQLLS